MKPKLNWKHERPHWLGYASRTLCAAVMAEPPSKRNPWRAYAWCAVGRRSHGGTDPRELKRWCMAAIAEMVLRERERCATR